MLNADISQLWSLFQGFANSNVLGLVENMSDWYLPERSMGLEANPWPALGRGVNSGVILMQLKRLRQVSHKFS